MGDIYTNPPQSRNEAILRATIDGTEYTAPPQSRIEDLLLELKEAIEQGGGAGGMSKDTYDPDDAVATAGGIAAYVDDEITDLHLGAASTKNSTSVVTQSTDLVESGAVYDALGFGNKNLSVPYTYSTGGSEFLLTYDNNKVTVNGTLGDTDILQPISSVAKNNGYIFDLPAGTFTVSLTGDTANIEPQIVKSDGSVLEGTTITLDTPTTIFLRVMVKKNNTFNNQICYIQLEKGSVATAYEPYHTSANEYFASKDLLKDTVGWTGKNLLPKFSGGTSNGVTFTVDSDGVVTANGTASVYNAQIESPFFTAQYDGMLVLNGCDSNNASVHMYPWCVTDSARPYADATKTSRLTYLDNVYQGNSISFYMERGKVYLVTCRVMEGSTANNQLFYPMLSKDGGTYEPYHASVEESLDDKCDNSVIGTVEDGTNPTKAYAVGEHFIRNGKFCTVTVAVTTSSTWTLGSNYVEGYVADEFGIVEELVSLGAKNIEANSQNSFSIPSKTGYRILHITCWAGGSGAGTYSRISLVGSGTEPTTLLCDNKDTSDHTWQMFANITYKKASS